MRPDWATFETFWQQILLQKSPKFLATIWANLKNCTFFVKTAVATFRQLLEKNGQNFIATSGHTVGHVQIGKVVQWEK